MDNTFYAEWLAFLAIRRLTTVRDDLYEKSGLIHRWPTFTHAGETFGGLFSAEKRPRGCITGW